MDTITVGWPRIEKASHRQNLHFDILQLCEIRHCSHTSQRALPEMLVDKIITKRHPSKIDKGGKRHYLSRAIPYQDPQQEAERLNAVHEARVKIVVFDDQTLLVSLRMPERDLLASVPRIFLD